ncbi:MAG: hypothetical protein ACJ746_04955 [Bryobacteraceae bacterium]
MRKLLAMPRMASSFQLAENPTSREFNAFSFPLRLQFGFRLLWVSRRDFAGFGSIHLLFDGFALPAARHVPIVRTFAGCVLAP